MRSLIYLLISAAVIHAQVYPKCMDCGLGTQRPRSAAYQQLIEPLLKVPDFHMHYYDDGAADATVTCPHNCDGWPLPKPVPEVQSLLQTPKTTVPLLIDCLDDGRQTSVRFDGNVTTRPMQVPLGYVCLDILMSRFVSDPIADYECNTDGLGACLHTEYYFRPDDYTHCWNGTCDPRPWVVHVQKNWQRRLKDGTLWKAERHPKENPN